MRAAAAWSVILMVVGLVVGQALDVVPTTVAPVFLVLTTFALAVEPYANTFGLDVRELARNKKTILQSISIGVLLKIAIIGGAMSLIFRDPIWFLIALGVSQIDPMSVGEFMEGSEASPQSKALMRAWAAFDDTTVVVMLLGLIAILRPSGLTKALSGHVGLVEIARTVSIALSFAAAVWLIYRIALTYSVMRLRRDPGRSRRRPRVANGFGTRISNLGIWVVAFAVLGSIFIGSTALALVGLFARPAGLNPRWLSWLTRSGSALACLGLGFLLDLRSGVFHGVLLGLLAFTAHALASQLVIRRLPRTDRLAVVFAQQNGTAAVAVALLLHNDFPTSISVLSWAVVTVNVASLISNHAAIRLNWSRRIPLS
ncbi:NhaP-type Na+/H+ or K+/H+ antiporter [Micromonospora kangleipakensis]|uniref:NhaP-type Na+/H+ or K+/H+ antiporter n=1 Tax=Micromonospora kangleipakensis TaxID=1077942 RepID=A0A4Q8BAV5_9ACTN|nr:cation:proton antiporter [Micromonospora kangleipakensis]RZU74922.1 NhaP-type Na+/H+ or K+/H+ antiporter [Micromonospora kangleipakensis]